MYRKVVPMRLLHPLPDAISDENFDRTKKLNPYYYCLKHGLSHGIGNARLATFLFREKCTESLCDMSLARTFRRHFRRKSWPHEKTEPLLLPFERWALTWYRYWSAGTVPFRGKCTEKWCPWGDCTHFQTPFPTEILAVRKNWTLIITV